MPKSGPEDVGQLTID